MAPPPSRRGGKTSSASSGGGSTVRTVVILAAVAAVASVVLGVFPNPLSSSSGGDGNGNLLDQDADGLALDAWLRERDIFPAKSPVTIAASETTGRGLFLARNATKPLPKGSSVMCVPRTSMWDREAIEKRTRLGRECAHVVDRGTGVSAGAFKALLLMLTASGAEEPEWVGEHATWLRTWPGRWDAPSDPRADGVWQLPTLWPREQIAELQFPVALVRADDEYEAVRTHILRGCGRGWIKDAVLSATDIHGGSGPEIEVPVLTDEGVVEGSRKVARDELLLGRDAFARAFSLAQSRWFGTDAATREGANAFQLESRDPFDLDDYIFLPGADAMNHIKVAGGLAHTLRVRRRDGAHCVVTTAEVRPGEELRLDYGSALPNRIFFATYGFLNPDPRSESVLFTLPTAKLGGVENDPRVAPHVHPALGTIRFEIRRKNHASLLGFDRLVAAGLNASLAEDCFCGMDTDYPDYEDCGVDEQIDMASRQTVVKQIDGVIKSLPTTLQEDREALMSMRSIPTIAVGRRMLAIMFRMRLKGILTTQLEQAQQMVKNLEQSIKVGKSEAEWKAEMDAKYKKDRKATNMEELHEHIKRVVEEAEAADNNKDGKKGGK